MNRRRKTSMISFRIESQLKNKLLNVALRENRSLSSLIVGLLRSSLDSQGGNAKPGGIQEETTYLGIPCLTMRPNTERPITTMQGTNQLGTFSDLKRLVDTILYEGIGRGNVPELWDGNTSERVVKSIKQKAS